MKVLIACEFSGIVRDAFAARGHDAWSCDLLPSERPGNHYQCDIYEVLYGQWDMLIAFPPCTHLCASGALYWPQKQKDGRQRDAFNFFMAIAEAEIFYTAIENPVGILSSLYRKPDQIINPFQFGDAYRKKTCLWLKNLPLLIPTNIVHPNASWCSGGKYGGRRKDGTRHIRHGEPSGKRNSTDRSRTFQGIANAMAEQWG